MHALQWGSGGLSATSPLLNGSQPSYFTGLVASRASPLVSHLDLPWGYLCLSSLRDALLDMYSRPPLMMSRTLSRAEAIICQ